MSAMKHLPRGQTLDLFADEPAQAEASIVAHEQRRMEVTTDVSSAWRAVESLARAASGYANGGFLLKAIAVGKTILQVDPAHTSTQAMLVEQ